MISVVVVPCCYRPNSNYLSGDCYPSVIRLFQILVTNSNLNAPGISHLLNFSMNMAGMFKS